MEMLAPDFLRAIGIAAGLSVAMLLLGIKTKLLELCESSMRCPSCRRLIRRGTVCPCAH